MHKAVWAVIPAYNEEGRVERVVASICDQGIHCAVIDDGSDDRTGEVARSAGAEVVLRCNGNAGYETALGLGLRMAATKPDCSWIVSIDADGELDPEAVGCLIKQAETASAAVGIGVRAQLPRLSEKIAARILHPLTGIEDPLCGLKAYRSDVVQRYTFACGRRVGMELAVRVVGSGGRMVQRGVPSLLSEKRISRFGAGIETELKIVGAAVALVPVALRGNAR